jgi:hypothetical protein
MSRQRREMLAIDKIRIDGDTQPRCAIDHDAVDDYAKALAASEDVPPVEVTFDGKDYWLWDGFHRYHGCRKAGITLIDAIVHLGTLEDARWWAVSANQKHGLRRTNADKRRAVEMAIKLRPTASNNAIADHAGVSSPFVGEVRRSLETVSSQSAERTGRDGRTINTANIGRKAETPSETTREKPAPTPVAAPKKKAPPASPPVLDLLGNAVPAWLKDVFADTTLAECIARVGDWQSLVSHDSVMRQIAPKIKAWPWLRPGDLGEHLRQAAGHILMALETLQAALPHSVCPSCEGEGCDDCRKSGYVPAWRLDELRRDGAA